MAIIEQEELSYAIKRVNACWDAMTGIEDPAAFMEEVREVLEALPTLRDYISDVLAGVLVYSNGKPFPMDMAREDLKRIDAALAKVKVRTNG